MKDPVCLKPDCAAGDYRVSRAARLLLAAVMLLCMAPLAAAQTNLRQESPANASLDPKLIGVLKAAAAHVLSVARPVAWDPGDAARIGEYRLLVWSGSTYAFSLSHFSPYGQADIRPGEETFEVGLAPNGEICPSQPMNLPAPGSLTTERRVYNQGSPLATLPYEHSEILLLYAVHRVNINVTITYAPPGAAEERALRLARVVHDGMVAAGLGTPCGTATGAVGARPAAGVTSNEGVPTPADTPWKTIVGVGAAAVLAIGALARTLAAQAAKRAAAKLVAASATTKAVGKRAAKEQEPDDPNRAVGYILQLSADQIPLTAGVPATLAVTVWAVKADGSHSMATDAQILLTPAITLPGLRIEPSSGAGRLQSTISWAGGSAPSPTVTLSVTAAAGAGTHSGSVTLALDTAQIVWEFEGGKRAIRPDGKDWTVLKAKVVQGGAGTVDNDAATATVEFAKSNEWLEMSDTAMLGTSWKAIRVEARDPAGPDSRQQPPSPVSFTITAKSGETDLSVSAPVELLARPELDVDLRPDTVTLIQGDATPVTFHAFITNPGTEPWTWKTTLEKEDFCTVGFVELESPGVVAITVTPPAVSPSDTSGAQIVTKLHIVAEQGGIEPLERILFVTLAREGLIVRPRGRDGEGRYVVRCDMETRKEIDFLVYAKDPSGRLIASPQQATKLWFEDNCPDQQLRNLLSVAKPEIKLAKPTEEKGYTWTVRSQDFVPGDTDDIYSIPMTVRVIGHEDKPEFSADLVLGLEVMEPDIGSDDWRKEVEACLRAIRFVPEPAKSKLTDAIHKHAQTLGHEGLKFFRKKIWRIAQDLILADGAEGFRDQAKWEDRALFLTENLKWGTDLIFTAASGVALGPVGVIGAPMLKSLVENILVVGYERGFGEVDDWFWECETELEMTLNWAAIMKQGALAGGGMATDPAVLEKILGNSPRQQAAAWAIYVGYQFASNMMRGMSMCAAMTQTLRTVRDRLVVQFLMAKMKWSFQTPQAIKDAAARMTGNPPAMTKADMIAIQSEAALLRSLKDAPANVRQGFLKTYQEILIAPHDAQLVAHVRTLPGYQGRVVRVESFSTPGKSGSGVGADRDFRVTMQNPDGTWREVPAELWRPQSNTIVGELSGGRSLHQLNWRATDRFDIEASPDYATQNGQVANITQVKVGKTVLKDARQFGNMWQQKMTGVEFEKLGREITSPARLLKVPPLENVAQAQKACSALTTVRGGYQQQGYKVGNLSPQMQKGMQIVQGANVTATGNYTTVNEALRKAGFKGGFDDFANKVASQFQALDMASK